MKSFVLSLVLLVAVAVAGTGPAGAAVSPDDRGNERRMDRTSFRDSGSHLHRLQVARASINDSDDYQYRSYRSEGSRKVTQQKRAKKYAGHSKKRYAKSSKRKYAHRKGNKQYTYRSSKKRVATRSTKRRVAHAPSGSALHGMASFYWQPQRVAAGGWFNPNAMTAAHKTLPFGTRVRVTHLGNGRSVDVKINDRGPYIAGRIIDLSKAAAGVIGMQGQGVARVKVTVLGRDSRG